MKYVLKNIKSFIYNEKMIFFVTVICIIASAFVINFSYGLYYNYNTKIIESEIDTKDLGPEISDGKALTKKEFQTYVEALDYKTLNAMTVIYATSYLDEFSIEEGYGPLAMRFVIHDGKYGICDVTKKNYEEHGLITSGRYITSEEEATGSFSAMVWGENETTWNEAGEKLKNDDGTITLFGNTYEVVGTYHGAYGTPVVPFLTVPNNQQIAQVGFSFEKNITKSAYENMVDTAEAIIPRKLIFPEMDFPDNDTLAAYNNMIYIAIILSVISVVNYAVLYYFILQKRQRKLSIMRISGCTKKYAVLMYLGECAIIVLPCYATGAAINYCLCKKIFYNVFEYFEKAYSFKIYSILFLIYLISFIIITMIMIAVVVNRTIKDSLREAGK